ncbi:branched-chain amino acid transporter permease [Treponema sp.]|uniref:branched-chain amino acid transporter permease n=1 Tax=Treponema sp. TaxID=166 RepID=UPI00388F3273
MKLTSEEALIATLVIGIMMFLLRFLPFLIFAKRKTPAFFSFAEKFIPAVSIAVLFTICFKERTTDLIFLSSNPVMELPSFFSAIAAGLITVFLHLWKNNAMISIFGGTIIYMLLNYLF